MRYIITNVSETVCKTRAEAVLSGNDLLCCSTYDRQVPAVLDAVADGTIPEARIDQSVRRILELKTRMGILKD